VHAGGLGVTLYATLAPEQIGYVAADCDARIAVLDGAAELARWRPVLDRLPGITKVIVCDRSACPAGDRYMAWADLVSLGRERLAAQPGEITARVAAIKPDDPLALLYTSGTTGSPKGVVLTHRNILYAMAAADATGVISPRARWVSYLPLAHIAERMFSVYLPIHAVGHVHFCPDPARLVQVIGKVRPTAFFDGRPYLVALLTLDGEAAPGWARARGIPAGCLAALASDPQVLAEVAAGIAAANGRLARVQQVKRWRLLPVEWTAETEELTPTLKLKRRVVHARYADVIESLYAG
jgi:long-subunit acyl-CoA synthetase (AMP-forming)